MRARRLAGTVLAVVAGAGTLASCGGTSGADRAAILGVVRAYAAADAAHDGAGVCGEITARLRHLLGSHAPDGRHRGGSCAARYRLRADDDRRASVAADVTAFAVRVRDATRRSGAVSVKTDGDTGTAAIAGLRTFGSSRCTFTLRRQDGRWRIDDVPVTAVLE